MKVCVLLIFLVLYSFLSGIDVEGSIYEDTVWSPENNPYHVVGDIIVEEDVTLTIEPGVLVLLKSMLMYDLDDFISNANYNSIDHTGNIFVYGELETIGTETDSIRFTRDTDSLYYHWGIIRIYNQESRTHFRYCHIDHSSAILTFGSRFEGSITSDSRDIIIEDCYFFNNYTNISRENNPMDSYISVRNSSFMTELGEIGDYWGNNGVGYSMNTGYGYYTGNYFESKDLNLCGLVAYNTFRERYRWHLYHGIDTPIYIYDNDFGVPIGSGGGIHDTILNYCDVIIAGNEIVNIGNIDLEFIHGDFYFFNNQIINTDIPLDSRFDGNAYVFNNFFDNSLITFMGGFTNIFNNISINTSSSGIIPWRAGSFFNNIFVNNSHVIDFETIANPFYGPYENCVFLDCNNPIAGDPLFLPGFRNCLLDFDLPISIINLGGNIIDEDMDAEDVFINPDNGNFHHVPGSVCIDAGYETDYLPMFDYGYHQRIWDGDEDGTAEIDIGVFEYDAPALGGIEGYTYNLETAEILKNVFVCDDTEVYLFDVSDSTGYYRITLADGVYDPIAEFPFYQDLMMEGVTVNNGVYTELDLYLAPDGYVEIEEDEIIETGNALSLYNYPNPFNPETTISFSTTEDIRLRKTTTRQAENTEINIYNIKGQRIRSFKIQNLKFKISTVVWDGKDDRGRFVCSGVYLCRLRSGDEEACCKMMLIK